MKNKTILMITLMAALLVTALVPAVAIRPPAPVQVGTTDMYLKLMLGYSQELAPGDSTSIDFNLDPEVSSQLHPCVGAVLAKDPITEQPPVDQHLDITCRVTDIGKARIWIKNNGTDAITIYQRAMVAVTHN